MRESGLILLEAAPAHIDRNAVAADLAAHAEGVTDIHHMHVWTLDGRQLMATLHARLKPAADAEQSIRSHQGPAQRGARYPSRDGRGGDERSVPGRDFDRDAKEDMEWEGWTVSVHS